MSPKLIKISGALLALLTISSAMPMASGHADNYLDLDNFSEVKRYQKRYAYHTYNNKRLVRAQAHYQRNRRFIRKFRRDLSRVIRENRRAVMREPVAKDNHSYTNSRWFKDGLSKRNLRARNWVSFHESSHRWNVLSYGGVCIGYFQLDPGYLGYRHGHVNLNHKHQVQVADAYVKIRYGSWVKAQRFWEAHDWY